MPFVVADVETLMSANTGHSSDGVEEDRCCHFSVLVETHEGNESTQADPYASIVSRETSRTLA